MERGIGGDDSANDYALCKDLAKRIGGDELRIDRLFRQSGLLRPKWDEPRPGGTYGSQTIRRAIANVDQAVTPSTPPPRRGGVSPVLINMEDVAPEAVEWIWQGRIAVGKTTMLCGDPGLGKSWITLDMATRISTGRPWPDGSPSPPATR
jgi:hypothetical protein